ncbi:MAG: MarR family transcriptional regulator [Alcaligenaceae bacterium]|nr:MarR family transcriptional regulator [Alcaligenaceae bacterium]
MKHSHSTSMAQLARTYHLVTKMIEKTMGIPSNKWRIFYLIITCEGQCTQKYLTNRIGVDPGAVTRLLKKIEQEGIISRSPDPEDNRITLVSLTELGRAEVERILELREGFLAQIIKNCSHDEMNTFQAVLQKMETNARNIVS